MKGAWTTFPWTEQTVRDSLTGEDLLIPQVLQDQGQSSPKGFS